MTCSGILLLVLLLMLLHWSGFLVPELLPMAAAFLYWLSGAHQRSSRKV
jgi:hypothetical protein